MRTRSGIWRAWKKAAVSERAGPSAPDSPAIPGASREPPGATAACCLADETWQCAFPLIRCPQQSHRCFQIDAPKSCYLLRTIIAIFHAIDLLNSPW